MSSWKQQALIAAPIEQVWAMIEDPQRYPEWNSGTLAVTGVPTDVEKGSTFQVRGSGPLGMKGTTTFEVEELDEDLREIRLRCQTSGYYGHWVLTEARGQTFADVEIGVVPPPSLEGRALNLLYTKRYLRRLLEASLDGLHGALSRTPGAP